MDKTFITIDSSNGTYKLTAREFIAGFRAETEKEGYASSEAFIWETNLTDYLRTLLDQPQQ